MRSRISGSRSVEWMRCVPTSMHSPGFSPNFHASITGSANVYVTSYGTHRVQLHRHVRSSVVLCIDPDYWAIGYLRRPFMEKLAKTGDADKYAMRAELTLVSRNHKANAKVIGCA